VTFKNGRHKTRGQGAEGTGFTPGYVWSLKVEATMASHRIIANDQRVEEQNLRRCFLDNLGPRSSKYDSTVIKWL
jgi:hypothetical protein